MSSRILPPPSSAAHAKLSRFHFVPRSLAPAGVLALLALHADAAPTGPSIPIKFGADESNGAGGVSSVDSAAGVLNTATWNNTSFLSGGPVTLNRDTNGTSAATTATVTWSSANTWTSTGRGEENNIATGENRDLMAGYLDTAGIGGTGATVTVTGLNFPASPFTLGYDVYVYMQGGVTGRGGTYSMNGGPAFYHEVTNVFDGTFIEDTTPDTPTGPEATFGSNYLVFRNVTGDSFTLTSTATFGGTPRAPVNAIEVVAVPEPISVAAIAGGVALLLGWRRRRPT